MNTTEQEHNRKLNQIKKQLVKDPESYIESVGPFDAHNLVDIVHGSSNKNTVLRLIMGASTLMPGRALSYVDSALRVAGHIPVAQIQIVHANHLGNKVNGVDLLASRRPVEALSAAVTRHLVRFPELEGRVLHAIDSPLDTDQYVDAVAEALKDEPELRGRLTEKGAKHEGNPIRYAAAHYAFQDTDNLELFSIGRNAPDQVSANTIISIGCQQERLFYRTRMAMRALIPPEIRTAQLFTKHVTPPYYYARDEDRVRLSLDWQTAVPMNPAAERDMAHFLAVNPEYDQGNTPTNF